METDLCRCRPTESWIREQLSEHDRNDQREASEKSSDLEFGVAGSITGNGDSTTFQFTVSRNKDASALSRKEVPFPAERAFLATLEKFRSTVTYLPTHLRVPGNFTKIVGSVSFSSFVVSTVR